MGLSLMTNRWRNIPYFFWPSLAVQLLFLSTDQLGKAANGRVLMQWSLAETSKKYISLENGNI